MGKYLISVLLFLEISFVLSTDWCNIKTCRAPSEHIMCLYKRAGPSPKCVRLRNETDDNFRRAILKAHNDFRDQWAAGAYPTEKSYRQASDMRLLHYDRELEKIAQRNVENCLLNHDKCRDVGRFKVGQSLAIFWSDNNMMVVADVVPFWAEHHKRFSQFDLVGPYKHGVGPDEFTQLIWASTRVVGCAVVYFSDPKKRRTCRYVACNYGPAGNMFGERVYRRGKPCSRCPVNTRCDPEGEGYKNLCAGLDRADEEYIDRLTIHKSAGIILHGFQGCIVNYFFLVLLSL